MSQLDGTKPDTLHDKNVTLFCKVAFEVKKYLIDFAFEVISLERFYFCTQRGDL